MTLEELINAWYPDFVAIRRRLHQHPELGTKEMETGKIILEYLEQWGISYEYPVADTGIVAIVRGNGMGNTVALRADIDALPITESGSSLFASLNPGIMHACGHDVHTAIALCSARILKETDEDWGGCVKIFFQPAEETVGGAERMIKAGCMENPHVDYVAGLHVVPYYDAGHIEVKYGKLNASSDEVRITVRGKGCHGAYPDNGVDAIVTTASLITSLQSLVSRNISPLDNAALTFGMINGGTAGNIVADKVTITGTLRTTNQKTRISAIEIINRQTHCVCEAFGASGEALISPGYDALINTVEIVNLLIETATPILGEGHIHWKEFSSLGVEDFSFFLNEAPGIFYHLGCGNQEKGVTAPIHNSCFAVDEECLKTGVRLQTELALKLLKY